MNDIHRDVDEMLRIFESHRKNPFNLHFPPHELSGTLEAAIASGSPLRLVLPMFHGKSPVRLWTDSNAPDLGDLLTMGTLSRLLDRLRAVYPDTYLEALSEGHLGAQLRLGGTDADVDEYLATLAIAVPPPHGITLQDGSALLQSSSYQDRREELLARWAPPEATVRGTMPTNALWRTLYCSYVRLQENILRASTQRDDCAPLPRREAHKMAKPLAMLQLRTHLGFGNLISAKYDRGKFVKLSALYKTPDQTNQVGINVIEGNHGRGTPSFHCVLLSEDGRYSFVKTCEAEAIGARRMHQDGLAFYRSEVDPA